MTKAVHILVTKDTNRGLKNKSFAYRAWAGLSIVRDVLQRAGYEVGYTQAEDAGSKVVLASVISADAWYDLVNEWESARPSGAVLIVGGAGVLNVRPFLPLPGAVFVLGRGEDVIVPVVEASLTGANFEHESVIYPALFDASKVYRIAQGTVPYPHTVMLENGKPWAEISAGCQYRCSFCNYSWTRSTTGSHKDYGQQLSKRRSVIAGGSNFKEHNLNELVADWRQGGTMSAGGQCNSAIDGQPQRIRDAVHKPVKRQDLIDAAALCPRNVILSLMTIVSLPTETRHDRREALDDLIEGLRKRDQNERWSIEISPNVFRPMPATPSALWPTRLDEWDLIINMEWASSFENHRCRMWTSHTGNVGLKKMAYSTGSAASLLVDLIAHRCTENDYGNIVKIARSRRFWQAPPGDRRATLEKLFDIEALVREYSPEDYPARYLEGHTRREVVERIGKIGLDKLRSSSLAGLDG
jgi:hypothetical protein